MKIYLLCPTLTEVGKLRLVLCLGASIIPRIDVKLCIAAVMHLLMFDTPPCGGACPQGVPILNIESTQEAYIHIVVSFDDVRVGWGSVPCGHKNSTRSRYQGWYKSTLPCPVQAAYLANCIGGLCWRQGQVQLCACLAHVHPCRTPVRVMVGMRG